MAIFYFVAGVVHLRRPEAFLPIMPDWIPAPREVILFTGVRNCPGARAADTFVSMVGCGDARPVCCLRFPANVKHAFENVQLPQLPSS